LSKVANGIGLALFALWGASAMNELAARAPGEPISIIGQLFFSAGLPCFILFLIIAWLKKQPVKNTKKRAKQKKGGWKPMP